MEPTVNIHTLTGLTMAEAIAILDEELPADAYKPAPGPVDLTDIKPAWLTQYLNRVFGISGFGWWFTYAAEDLHVMVTSDSKGRPVYEAALDRLEFYYRLIVNGEWIVAGPVLANGGSGNGEREYAVRGALTNALGAAASKLGWQLSVYQDRRGHSGKSRPAPRPTPRPEKPQPAAPDPVPATPSTREAALATVIPGGKYKGRTLEQLLTQDPGYLHEIAENAKTPALRAAAQQLLQETPLPAPPVPAAPATPPPALTPEQARARAVPFGTRDHPEYKGLTLEALAARDAGFVQWLSANAPDPLLRQAATLVLTG